MGRKGWWGCGRKGEGKGEGRRGVVGEQEKEGGAGGGGGDGWKKKWCKFYFFNFFVCLKLIFDVLYGCGIFGIIFICVLL